MAKSYASIVGILLILVVIVYRLDYLAILALSQTQRSGSFLDNSLNCDKRSIPLNKVECWCDSSKAWFCIISKCPCGQ